MAYRAAALAALLSLVGTVSMPEAASADAPAAYSYTPGTLLLSTGWSKDEQGIGHFYSIVLKPDGCLVREFASKGTQLQTTDSACHLMPGGFPALGKTGIFAITADFPGYSQQIIFRTTPTSVSTTPGDNPGLSGVLLGDYGSMASPPPVVDLQRANQWSSATTPTVHQVFHLVTAGLDCKFEIVGEGATPCVLSSWTDRDLRVLISGAFLHQPDAILHIDAHLTPQGWVMGYMDYAPNPPLKLAVLHHDLQAVDALLPPNGKPGVSDADLDASLRAALAAGQMDIAKALVDHGAPLNSATQYQVPVLNLAAGIDDHAAALELVTDMVAHGASVTQGGSSSLFYAMGANDPAMVEFLLDHGADPNAQTYLGSTKVSAYQAASGNVAILDMLLRHGAKPQVTASAQRPIAPAPQGHEYAQGANGPVIVVTPPVERQYEYSSGPSQPATAQAGAVAAQGHVVLYGGDYQKDGPISGHALLIDGSKCRYQVTRLDPGGATATDYACQLLPGSQPILPGQPGMFMLTLKLPEGPVTLRGTSNDGLWFDMQSASQRPASLRLASRLGLMTAPLPVMQADSDDQPGMHFAINGFDCIVSVTGQGSSHCLLTGWGPLGPGGASKTSVLASGDFLRQPARAVYIDFGPGASGWVMTSPHLYPYTPAMLAAYRGDLRSLDDLIAKGADLSSHDPHLDAPLAMAIARDHTDIAAALIAHGAKLDEPTLAGSTVLMSVINHEWHDPAQPMGLVTQLLDRGADPNRPDKRGTTPLIAAIERGQKDVVRQLVDKGVDVNARPGYAEQPLDLAIFRGESDIAKLLIAHGADVNAATHDGETPLMAAIKSNNLDPAQRQDMVKFLLDHGAEVNHAGEQGVTPLMLAVVDQQPDIAKLLIAKGADPHAKADLNGRSMDAAALGAMAKQYQVQAAAEQEADAPLPNQGMPVGALLRFQPLTLGGVTLVGQPGAAGSGETVTVTDVNGGKRAGAAVRKDGSFTVALPGAAHDLFMVQMSNAQAVADAKARGEPAGLIPREQQGPPVYMHGDDPVLGLTASVASAAPITDAITVIGTYTGPLNTSIRVGGYPAQVSDGRFVANDVHLQQGDNAIPIKLTTQGGLVLEQTLKVTGAGHTGIMIGMNPYSGGTAPLKVDFFCRSVLPGEDLKSLRFSYLGDGKDDVATTDAKALAAAEGRAMTRSLVYTYPKPGIYPVKATAATAAGVTTATQMFVMVQDAAKLDAVLKALWGDYLTAFGNGDKAALMQLLDDDARQTLGSAFDQQKGHARDILKGYSPLYGGSFSGAGAVYTLQRDGQTTLVSFVRSTDGVWRIGSIGGG